MAENNKCAYCGNNPVPHFLTWYNESLNILLTPVRSRLLYNPLTRRFKRHRLGQRIGLMLVKVLSGLKVISLRKNKEQCKVPRAKVLWDEAEKRGIEMAELLFFGKPFDAYAAVKDLRARNQEPNKFKNFNSKIIFSGLPRPSDCQNSVLDAMDDKWFLKKLFLTNYLPVPAGAAVTTWRQARNIFQQISKPVIVKPRTGSRGRHSTTFVRTEADLREAFGIAKKLCHWVMVEEQLSGPVYRATLIDFKLRGVLRGDQPLVTGDGSRSLGELINIKNSLPHPGVKDIIAGSAMERFVSRQLSATGHAAAGEASSVLAFVPKAGQVVELSEKIGVNYGGSSSEDLDECHPDNRELFIRAAQAVGDPIVGFDFIIGDIAKSYNEQQCGFIEANSLPFINLHHDPLLGRPQNVAAAVWDMAGL